jgi:hypothetical protein
MCSRTRNFSWEIVCLLAISTGEQFASDVMLPSSVNRRARSGKRCFFVSDLAVRSDKHFLTISSTLLLSEAFPASLVPIEIPVEFTHVNQ